MVTTDASGNASFAVTLPGATASDFITATATSIAFTSDFAVLINTSEFSAPVTAAVTPPPGDANHGHGNDPDHVDDDNPGQGLLHATTATACAICWNCLTGFPFSPVHGGEEPFVEMK
jgi:hypothetical protein